MTQTSVGTISPRWEMEIPLAEVSSTKAESIFPCDGINVLHRELIQPECRTVLLLSRTII
ncbi:hypothetical protein [Sphingobacterium sp. UBA7249]|nr:hypothetical protein [Sphingobacterium sp. UBA7249]